jgi:hypothetical protein
MESDTFDFEKTGGVSKEYTNGLLLNNAEWNKMQIVYCDEGSMFKDSVQCACWMLRIARFVK